MSIIDIVLIIDIYESMISMMLMKSSLVYPAVYYTNTNYLIFELRQFQLVLVIRLLLLLDSSLVKFSKHYYSEPQIYIFF